MQKHFQKIVVIGLGYIGLPTASMLATKGHQVIGVDVNEDIINTINSGSIHIVEPDLDILVRSAVKSGNLRASLTPQEADAFILAVPTPFKNDVGNCDKVPDLSHVEAAAISIAPFLSPGNLVILESTSPVGTTNKIVDILAESRPDLFTKSSISSTNSSVYVAHCPERVLPGSILRELVDNDRVIGGINLTSAEKARNLYKTFCNGSILLTDSRTAELSKIVENAYRDVNIAFANELSMISDNLGIDIWELISLANRHPRVNILKPGPGVGGHCISVDPWFVVSADPEHARLIRTAREVNDYKTQWIIDKVRAKAGRFKNPIIGCLGLAFKANVDDLRESPAIKITRQLIYENVGSIMACEPNVENFEEFPLFSCDEIIDKADIIVLLVDHDEFLKVEKDQLKEKVIIDTRGFWK
jgi:UDP-N-acetyl-D-mannosaminuronic acid dehydrogenase